MLSVQSPGCAGMERLGVPTRTSLGSPSDERSRIRRMRIDGVNDSYNYNNRQISNNHPQLNNFPSPNDFGEGRLGCAGCSRSQAITCPYHVAIPNDGEYTRERDIQMRVPYQQAEVIRSYIRPPPNKTVLDVPENSYTRMLSSISMSTICTDSSCSNLAPHSQHIGQSGSNLPSNHHQQQQQPPPPPQKTKPNPIAKFLHKISSSKSPPFSSSSSSSSTTTSSLQLSSDSSTSASLSSASTLPLCDIAIPTASSIGGSFNLGKQSKNSPSSATTTPCIGVTVPSAYSITSYDCGNPLHHNYHHHSTDRSYTSDHLQFRESNSACGTCLTIQVPTPNSSSTQSLVSLSSVSSMSSPSPSQINDAYRSRSPSFKDSYDLGKPPPNNATVATSPNTDYAADSEESSNVNGNNSNTANNSQQPSDEGGHI